VDRVEQALARMEEVDGLVASVCTRDGTSVDRARQRDEEAAAGRSRGPLHGKPVLVKDNIDTADLPTTAGSLALAGQPPSRDATLVRRLREAGMVVVGKTNLSEWANIRDAGSTSGWSAYGG
jgi:amidase